MDDRGTELADFVGRALAARAAPVARRWQERATAAAPRVPPTPALAGGADAERVVRALAAGLHKDACWQGEVMRLGRAAGAGAHAAGTALHHLVTDTDLLLAVVLAEAELAVAAEGVALARRLQRAAGLFAQAAVGGYLHAFVEALRRRWRVLRHDLRNPLGTIRGALSLMEDEALPLEARTGPRMRDMLARNAGSMERLIGAGLGDDAPRALLAAADPIPLRELALAVRRALREPAELVGCRLVVDEGLPAARVDAGAAELALTAVLLAGLQHAAPGDRLVVGGRLDGPRVAFTVTAARAPRAAADAPPADAGGAGGAADTATPWAQDAVELAAALADDAGGRVHVAGDALRLELPCAPAPLPMRGAPRRASAVEARDDVGRAD